MRHALTLAVLLACTCAMADARAQSAHALPGPAAAEPAFEPIGARQGLSSYSVFAAHVDRHGFVWFAGDNGLHRFDGHELHTLDRDPGRPGTLASRTNTALAETDDALWILSFGGVLQRLDRSDGTVHAFELKRPDGGTPGRGTSLAVDGAGRVWIGTDIGLFRFDRARGIATHMPLFGGNEPRVTAVAVNESGTLLHVGTVNGKYVQWFLEEALPDGDPAREEVRRGAKPSRPTVMDVPGGAVPLAFADGGNGHWVYIGTNQGLFTWSFATSREGVKPAGPEELRHGVIDALAIDDRRSLWLGGAQQQGLRRLDLDSRQVYSYRHHPDDPHSLPADRVNALVLDDRDNLWIGLERGGAARLRVGQTGAARHRAGDERGDSVCSMRTLPDGRIATVLCGDGLVVIDPVSGAVEDRQAEIDAALAFPAPSLIAHALAPDAAGGLWIPTNNLGLVRWDPESRTARRFPLRAPGRAPEGAALPDPYMNDAVVDADGTVWVACSLGLARLAPGDQQLTLLPRDAEPGRSLTGGVLSVAVARDGALWLGTTRGLVHYDPRSGHVQRHAFAADDPHSLSDDLVVSLHVAPDGRLWAGTQAGLNHAQPQADGTMRFVRYGMAEGLPDQTIDAITSDAGGRLWIGTHRGIAGFDAHSGRFRAYAPGDGVPDSPVNWRAALAAPDGSVYFGTDAGVLHLRPDQLAGALPPPVMLGGFEVAGEPRLNLLGAGMAPIETTHDRNRVRFSVAVFGDTQPLEYRMAGLDARWRSLPATLTVGYDPLPSGKYRFEVRHAGAATAALSVPVQVLPPPWRTRAAYAAYAFLVLLVLGWSARTYARKRSRERRHVLELHHLANYDALTGLPNRTLFGERLAAAMRPGGAPLALLFIDLDRFKNINDSLGHRFGDQVLVAAAQRLAQALPREAAVARLGGDEFTVVLPDLRHEHEAAAVAQGLLEAFAAPLKVEGSDVVVTLSVGTSLFPAHTDDPALLVQYADSAMYFAKTAGRNTQRLFQPEMVVQVSRRLALETSLRGALAAGELSLVFQPQLDLASGRIAGAEALLRWHGAEHGPVSPGEFVPILEDTGMIEPVGLWVVEQVCAHLRRWREGGLELPSIAVNVSVHQLIRGELSERLAELLGTHALPRHALEIEVTESALMENAQAMGAALGELRSLGLGIAIDDFGTGYSSFASLSHLPVDKLKIDKVFIDGLGRSDNAGTLCAAMIAMAHNLRLSVVAEGVETEAQHRQLAAMGCDQAQGFWYCRPLPLPEFEAFLRERMQHASEA